jgi:hypothetical protein
VVAKYDALAWTVESSPSDVVNFLSKHIDLAQVSHCKALYGWENGVRIHRGDIELARAYFGGANGSDCVHVRHEGAAAVGLEKVLREYISTSGAFHYATRVDVCEDWIQAGLFDWMSDRAIRFAVDNNLKIGQAGDWERGRERTLYIGSRQSEVMVRIYEKGYKSGGDPNWVRYETEVKPDKKPRRHKVANMTAGQLLFLGMSGRLLNYLGWNHLAPMALESVYQPSDAERARAALLKQYGKIISNWASELGGYSELAHHLRQEIEPAT